MRIKRAFANAAVTAGLLMAAFVPALMWSSPASAAGSNCQATQVCMYYSPGYSGGWARYKGDDYSYKDNTFDGCGTVFNRCELSDNTSSIDNDGASCASYHYKNYIGQSNPSVLKVSRGGYLSSMPSGWNDVLSSHVWCSPA